jgi:hypothetical protein
LNSLTTAPLGTELVKSQTSASVCGFNDIVIDRALIGFERQRIIVLLLKDLPGRSMFITKVMRANGRSVQIDPYKSGPTNRASSFCSVECKVHSGQRLDWASSKLPRVAFPIGPHATFPRGINTKEVHPFRAGNVYW